MTARHIALALAACTLAACSQSPESYYAAGDAMERATKNKKVGRSFEDFIAGPNYRNSRDFWRGRALEQYDPKNSRVLILLREQRGRLYINNQVAMDFPICSGSIGGSETPRGRFRISEKKEEHRSSLYGSFVDAQDRVVKSGVHASDKAPAGTHYRGALMPYWMRFNGAVGMHVGAVYREEASHGCVRVPVEACRILFEKLAVGSVVEVQ